MTHALAVAWEVVVIVGSLWTIVVMVASLWFMHSPTFARRLYEHWHGQRVPVRK